MDRCAVFVDAGWFLSESALAITGKGYRSAVQCDYRQLMVALADVARQVTELPVLRIYWYDAAPAGVPGPDHLQIAGLGGVKLRLGRISHHEQKGVDALLILDLTTLARERAIASALVISGDEDIREGVALAQSLGVHVTLGAVELPEGRASQATTLVQEADEQVLIEVEFLRDCIRSHEVEQPADGNGSARDYGFTFGASYADTLGDDELRALQREAPEMPAPVAAQLFRDAEQVFGPLRGRTDLRRELRAGFWDHVMRRRN